MRSFDFFDLMTGSSSSPPVSAQENNAVQIFSALLTGCLIGIICGGAVGFFLGKNSPVTYRSKSTYNSPSQCPTLKDLTEGIEILSIQWESRSGKCIYQYRVNVD